MASARANSRSRSTSTKRLVVCVRNEGYRASLEARKVYVALPDAEASRCGEIRVIDESGEDYLYPVGLFAPITVRESTRRTILASIR